MTIVKHEDQRVVVLLDVPNMYHSARALYQKRVNFKEVLKQAVSGRKLIRAIGYVIKTESGEEQSFFEALVKTGIETKTKELQVYPGGLRKGDWDVGLSIDAIRLAQKADVIVLITGDGDFVPLVEYLKNHSGIQVEIIGFGRSTSAKLKERADEFFNLEKGPKKFLLLSKYDNKKRI